MRTINQIISETCNTRRARVEIARDNRMIAIYALNPELERIDSYMFKRRRDNILKVIQEGKGVETIANKEMKDLIAKRKDLMARRGIDERFDEIHPECPLCKDTGYVKKNSLRVVCSCMSREIVEAYEEAGLSDYNSIVPKNFKPDYISSSASRRSEVYKSIGKILNSISIGELHPIYVYSDGPQTGKTYLSVVAIKIAITLGLSAAYTKCEDLININEDRLENYKNYNLLVIDDFISGATRNWNIAGTLNSILETRNSRGLATIIVSNESVFEMVEKSDERVAGKLSRATKI